MRIPVRLMTSSLAVVLCGGLHVTRAVESIPATAAKGQEDVRIYRDSMGIPHVFADTAPAVLFGAGYSLGEDRLADLELRRRGALGTRAEILGHSSVDGDITARERALSAAELMRMYRAIPAEHQAMMQAFVDGINRYIDVAERSPDSKLPYQFVQWGIRPSHWTLLDYLAVIASVPGDRGSEELRNAAFLEAMTARYGPAIGREIFDDVVPISDPDSPTAIPPGEDLAPAQPMPVSGNAYKVHGQGLIQQVSQLDQPLPFAREASRCLVIGPQRSASGHVLMMEATADGPEVHLFGGGFDTTGFSFPGWGAPIMGRSLGHGWLITSGQSDATDMFEERLNPANRYQYRFKGRWMTMEHRREIIKVKGEESVIHDVAHTVHGPVVSWNPSEGVAYAERYAERGHELDNWVGIVEMARAKNIAEFESKGVARVAWNLGVCYGDSTGRYGFWETGLLPKRAAGADSRLPTPGTGEYEWNGFLELGERPHMVDPKQGFIHAWNSKATSWSQEGDPARIGKTFRSWLGTQLAESNRSITLLDMREFNRKISNALGGVDRTNTSPAFFAPYLKAALAENRDPEVAEAVKLMLSFNGLYEDLDKDGYYDSPGLPIFREWLTVAPQIIFSPSMDDWWSRVDEDRYLRYPTSLLLRAIQGPEAGLPLKHDYFQGRERNAVLLQTVRATVDRLKPRYAGKAMSEWRLPIYWKYLDRSKITPERPEMPDPDARGSRMSAILGLEPYAVPHNGGDEWTGLMELDPNTESKLYSVTDTGGQDHFIDARGHGNPHLTDQTRMHADNEFKVIEMDPDKIRATAEAVETISYDSRR